MMKKIITSNRIPFKLLKKANKMNSVMVKKNGNWKSDRTMQLLSREFSMILTSPPISLIIIMRIVKPILIVIKQSAKVWILRFRILTRLVEHRKFKKEWNQTQLRSHKSNIIFLDLVKSNPNRATTQTTVVTFVCF